MTVVRYGTFPTRRDVRQTGRHRIAIWGCPLSEQLSAGRGEPHRSTITPPRHLHSLITRALGVPQSTAPDRGLIDDMRPSRRTPTRQRRGQPHDARRSRAWLTWGSSQLPRCLKNLRQNCLRLIVNVDGNLGLVAVPTTQTITPIFTGAGAVRARQWSFGPP